MNLNLIQSPKIRALLGLDGPAPPVQVTVAAPLDEVEKPRPICPVCGFDIGSRQCRPFRQSA